VTFVKNSNDFSQQVASKCFKMTDYPDFMPCVVCGKPAKTIRDKNGKAIQAGLHTKCGQDAIKVVEGERKRELNN